MAMLVPVEEVNAMKKLLEMMDNPPAPAVIRNGVPGNASVMSESAFTPSTQREEVADMKKILERLNAATSNAVHTLQEQANYDRDVREALETERTPTGARVGSWEIRVNLEEKMGKEVRNYDVIHSQTGEPIAKTLYLYEVAHGLVRLFNRGETLTSQSVRDLLTLEETYTRNRIDALRFKKRYNDAVSKKDYTNADIFEARYQNARQHALTAKERITDLYESL